MFFKKLNKSSEIYRNNQDESEAELASESSSEDDKMPIWVCMRL